MNQPIIQIDGAPIGVGQERACYRHPHDHTKVIKIQKGEQYKQTRRELEFYRGLQRRGMQDFAHIPRYYGQVDTNLGRGFVVDFICDHDGRESHSLWWYFEQGYPLAEFYPYLDELKRYMLRNLIVFSVDMGRFNILFKHDSENGARLVVIDGLGNHSAVNWFDGIAYFARLKINRRWRRCCNRLQHFSDRMMQANPKQLEPAYRRPG